MPNLHVLRFAAELPLGRGVLHLVRFSYDLFVFEGIIQAVGAMLYGVVCCDRPSKVFLQALDRSGFDYVAFVPQQVLRRDAIEAKEDPSPPPRSQLSRCVTLWAFARDLVQA